MKKWIRTLLKGFSLTAALFVFQACYGTPQVEPEDLSVQTENNGPTGESEAEEETEDGNKPYEP